MITVPSNASGVLNSRNLNLNRSLNQPIICSAKPWHRKILPKENNAPVANPDVNSEKISLEEKRKNAIPKQSAIEVVDITEEEDDLAPKDLVSGGVEVTVLPP